MTEFSIKKSRKTCNKCKYLYNGYGVCNCHIQDQVELAQKCFTTEEQYIGPTKVLQDRVWFSGNSTEQYMSLDITPRNSETKVFIKHDTDKCRWDLIPWEILNEVAEVLTSGEKKYPGENWKKCTDKNRYLNAHDRHMFSWRIEDRIDEETQKSHLINAICNLLFLAALEKNGKI